MRSYSLLLLNNAIVDAVSALASALTVIRLDILNKVTDIWYFPCLSIMNSPGSSEITVFIGICTWHSPRFCQLCICKDNFYFLTLQNWKENFDLNKYSPFLGVHLMLACHSIIILLHSFCFRLYLLRNELMARKKPLKLATALISLVLYLPTIVATVTFLETVIYELLFTTISVGA